ncbi:cyclic nucleotide-binding domain-containing protein [Rhodocaloribacter sp.]
MTEAKKVILQHAWDRLVSIGATVLALIIPLERIPGFWEETPLDALEAVVTVLFVIDVGVRLRRVDAGGAAGSLGVRLRRYARAGLLLDVLAAVPFRLFVGVTPLQFLRLLKLVRVAQFQHALRRRNVQHSNVLRLAFFVYWLFLSVHWISCGWIALRGAGAGLDAGTRYLSALYWCVSTMTTVGYGDVTPAGNAQRLYAIGVMILGVGVYGFIIGNIATILANIDPARAAFLRKVERLSAFMRYRRLPPVLQNRIRDYYAYLWEQRLVYDESDILNDLPQSLRTEIDLFLKRDIIENVPLFRGASDAFIREIALEMKPVVCLPGDEVIRAGERGDDMYFITRGVLEVLAPDGRTVINTLTDGDFFGEIALVLDQPRSAGVRAATYCDLYRLDRAMFSRVLTHYPGIAAQIEDRARERHGRSTFP